MSEYSRSQEYRIKNIFERYGFEARCMPMSGNAFNPELKGDIQAELGSLKVIVDHKSTQGKCQTTLKRADLENVRWLGAQTRRIPLLTLGFKSQQNIYAVISLKKLLDLITELKNERKTS